MATRIIMERRKVRKRAFIGWSWTSFFFGFFPAAFRGDWLGVAAWWAFSFILAIMTVGVGNLVFCVLWAFLYNKWHARRLMASGYKVAIPGPYLSVEEAEALIGAA